MKKILFIAIIFIAQQCYAADIQTVKQIRTVKFANMEFTLSGSDNFKWLFTNQYIRKGDSFKNKQWKDSFEINVYKSQAITPAQIAFNTATFINRKSPHPFLMTICDTGNKEYDNSQALLYYVNGPDNAAFMEFNIFYYFNGKDQNNIIGLHYTHRFYPPNLTQKIHAWLIQNKVRVSKNLWEGKVSTGNNISLNNVLGYKIPICKKVGYIDLQSLKALSASKAD